jgi:hypothetical protein
VDSLLQVLNRAKVEPLEPKEKKTITGRVSLSLYIYILRISICIFMTFADLQAGGRRCWKGAAQGHSGSSQVKYAAVWILSACYCAAGNTSLCFRTCAQSECEEVKAQGGTRAHGLVGK